jgi:hypothetical protein
MYITIKIHLLEKEFFLGGGEKMTSGMQDAEVENHSFRLTCIAVHSAISMTLCIANI